MHGLISYVTRRLLVYDYTHTGELGLGLSIECSIACYVFFHFFALDYFALKHRESVHCSLFSDN